MELVDSHLDLTDSYLASSVFSESSQLLQSRLSSHDMDKMERENLLLKLLQLYQALDNTEKENQLLRIQKAQLHNQLKTTKSKAQQFIQSNITAAQSLIQSPKGNFSQSIPRSPPKTSQNGCFMTPYASSEDFENNLSNNKVFIKSHNRAISNNCIVSDNQNLADKKKYRNTLMNSPVKEVSIRMEASKGCMQSSTNKITFPKSKLSALVAMEREYEERNEQEPENRTLENFQSFYCHQKDDFNQTQRRGAYQVIKKPQSISKPISNQHRIYQPFLQQPSKNFYQDSDSQKHVQKGFSNRSMSSSNLSNKDYCNSRGFKIPSSIDEIWGESNKKNQFKRVNNKMTTKLTKINANKTGLQRRTYLNC